MGIRELQNVLPVETPLGPGFALLVIDYGMNCNTVWVVALKKDGAIKHFDSNDLKVEINHTFKIGYERKLTAEQYHAVTADKL